MASDKPRTCLGGLKGDVGLFQRIFGKHNDAAALYAGVVARGRAVHWYAQGGVADTIDGRFDMIAAVLSLVLLRLEAERGGEVASTELAEAFVDDIDPQLREIGIGDVTVGKHMGKMMSMLGGRLGAYREGLAEGSIDAALLRNLYRDTHPGEPALAHTRAALLEFDAGLRALPLDAVIAGRLP